MLKDMIKLVEENSKDLFNKLATHPLQSWEWGEFRKKQGLKVVRFGVCQKEKLTQVFQLTLHPVPHIPLTIGYLPKSELPGQEVIDYLKGVGKKNKAIFIKLEPNVEKVNSDQLSVISNRSLAPGKPMFTKYNSIIDLTRTEDEILKSFKPKTRYNIKVAEKHGVIIKEDNSPEDFEAYLKLLFETTKRQGFFAHNEKFHRIQWEIMRPAGISHLLTATHQGKILAAHMFFVFNNILYYPYGASTRESREVMAPTLLMWEAIKFGKKMGCKSFDLWGDMEPNPPENHPYYGFHRFKEGFSPKIVEYIGTYDLVINQNWYRLYALVDKIRWLCLKNFK